MSFKLEPKARRLDSSLENVELIPGLPNAVAATCLARVGQFRLRELATVSRRWRYFISGGELKAVSESLKLVEELLYVLVGGGAAGNSNQQWKVFDYGGRFLRVSPAMPRLSKVAFGVGFLGQKLVIAGGYSVVGNKNFYISSETFQYDPCKNSWATLPEMNTPRYKFAYTVVNDKFYAIGGYGKDGYTLSTAEVYDPCTNRWTFIQQIRRPRHSSFAMSFKNKLYMIGGRSTSTIGSVNYVDIYEPNSNTWQTVTSVGPSAMITDGVTVDNKMYCLDWMDLRTIRVFNPENCSWEESVRVPIGVGSSISSGFKLGSMEEKLLLFPRDIGRDTLCYDPCGSRWETCGIKPLGSRLVFLTTKM